MKDASNKKMLRQYLDGCTDDSMSAIVQGWLFCALDDPEIDGELEGQFDRMVVWKEPTGATYERYRKLEHRLTHAASPAVSPASRPAVRTKRRRILLRVAAVLLPALVMAGALLYPGRETEPIVLPLAENTVIEGTQVTAGAGRKKKVELEDSSQVTVNGNSRIVYSDDFSVRREVYVDGEAHFVVEKDPNRPFFVRTKYVTIEVTGTEFNVRAVSGEERMTVSLTQGSVKIMADGKETLLDPGNEYEFDYMSRTSDVEPYSAAGWWSQPMVFHDMTLREIFDMVEDYHGVKLEGKENFTDTLRYNMRFDAGDSVEYILGTVSMFSRGFTFSGSDKTFVVTKTGAR